MTTVALKGMLGRKLRTLLTALAIVLGVALISGSYVLTDSISTAFHSIFTSSYTKTDAVVTAKTLGFTWSGTPTVSSDVLDSVRTVPDVEAATGSIVSFNADDDSAKIIDKHGKVITGNGNPTFGFGIDGSESRFSPLKLVDGAWSKGPGEVVIDKETAGKYGFAVGDRLQVAVDGKRWYRLSGIAGFGDVGTIGGATIAVFDVPTAQRLLHKDGFDSISVAARQGVSPQRLVAELRHALPNVQVRTGQEQGKEDEKPIQGFVGILRYILLGFGGIALFIGSFVIFNTLSITIAQRTRELATLRTLGASRRQVLRSVVLEAFVLGLAASLVGLAAGVGLAKGMEVVFSALAGALPSAGLTLAPRTIAVSVAAGVVVTVLASIFPARRATRVAPIAAVREGAEAATPQPHRLWNAAGPTLAAAGVAALAFGLYGHGGLLVRVATLLAGTLGLFLGVGLSAARLVRPIVTVIGAPSRRLGGAAGRIASENARRNPGRTAATSAALMIGLALVTFVTVFGKALAGSDERSIKQQATADYVVSAASSTSFGPKAAKALVGVPGVETVASIRTDSAFLGKKQVLLNGIEPAAIASTLHFEWTRGSQAAAGRLRPDEALVEASFARHNRLALGDRVRLTTQGRKTLAVRVAGVFRTNAIQPLVGEVVIPRATFDRSVTRPRDGLVLVNVAGEASPAKTQALAAALADYPDAEVATLDAFAKDEAADFTAILNLFYALLALSVVVSLLGMMSTLGLSVFERTRELGMLRAIGMGRRQLRRMVRHEGVITALIGAVLGIPLGIGLGAAAVHPLAKYGVAFSLPPRVVLFALIALGAGALAAILPARRAGRLNVLEALHCE